MSAKPHPTGKPDPRPGFQTVFSDGERREFGPGTVLLVEDSTGKGHYSRVQGPDDDRWFVAALAE